MNVRPISNEAVHGFAAACSAHAGRARPWVGIEHEFLCHDADGNRVDFRSVIDSLGLAAAHLVPTDPRARWLPTGTLLTADKMEAEIATPPADVGAGFPRRLDAWAAFERGELTARVPHLQLTGDSTHINVSLPADVDPDDVADMFVSRFACGQMLLMDRRHSPGLLVRPRPGRLEIGGEYAVGSALRSALAYAAGATFACIEAIRSGARAGLPPALLVRVERNVLRYGWYVARTAFGGDLYLDGRDALLATVDGGLVSADDSMTDAWAVARRHLEPVTDAHDLHDADAIAAGDIQLPIERLNDEVEHDPATPEAPHSAFGLAASIEPRASFELAPVLLTWELAVFILATADLRRSAFAAVPGRHLQGFTDALESGDLDVPIRHYLQSRHPRTRLLNHEQAMQPGLFDELGLRVALLAPERDYVGRTMRLRLRQPLPAGSVVKSGRQHEWIVGPVHQ